jgi:hypothetical protein
VLAAHWTTTLTTSNYWPICLERGRRTYFSGCGSGRGRGDYSDPGEPADHIGKVYELTGPKSQDMRAMAAEYSSALGRTITYVDVPVEEWRDQELPNAVRRSTF